MENSTIVPETFCTNRTCNMNMEGKCISISTLLDALEINGLPEPDDCEHHVQ